MRIGWVPCGFLVAMLATSLANAQTMEDKYTYEVPYQSAAKAFALGMVDRHLTIMCELEVQATGETVISNPKDCMAAAKELESVFEGQLMELEVDQRIHEFMNTYRMQYPI